MTAKAVFQEGHRLITYHTLDRSDEHDTMGLTLQFFKESQMRKFFKDPDKLVFKAGLTVVLAIELYKFIRFIAG